MSCLGVVGLGWMGNPMAKNLVNSGFDVMVFDLRPEAVEELEAAGARSAANIKELAQCDPVLVIVQTGAQVWQVVEQLAEALPNDDDHTVAIMSTVTPQLVRELAQQYEPAGFKFVDAPVSGAPIVAQMAALSIMVGGDRADLDKLMPYFKAMGQSIEHMGTLGSGMAMKMVNNIIGLANAYILPEALKLGAEGGLDMAQMIKVMRASSGSTWLIENWDMYVGLLGIVADDPSQRENFNLIARKDLQSAVSMAENLGIDSPVTRSVKDIMDNGDIITPEMFEIMSAADIKD